MEKLARNRLLCATVTFAIAQGDVADERTLLLAAANSITQTHTHTHTHTAYTHTFQPSAAMGFIVGTLKQGVLMAVMALAIPTIWWTHVHYIAREALDTMDVTLIETVVLYTAIAVALECICYLMLPIDIIPDSIPLLGHIDDAFAMVILILSCLVIAGIAGREWIVAMVKDQIMIREF